MVSRSEIGARLRDLREARRWTQAELAQRLAMSQPQVSQVERGLKKPSAEILGQIAGALRISAETLYVKAGLLEARDGDAAVTEAINTDETLSERQRQVLLEIYAAFQKENAVIREATTTSPDGVGAPTTGTADVTTS